LLGASALLLVWNAALLPRAGAITVEVVLKKQHYLQALAQGAVFVYWGWYWPPVYDFAPLILAQLAFAYAFDMLLGWSQRDTYRLGFGPFPVVFSTNLFLWFKPDWFYLQFAMLAAGLLAKALIGWRRDGQRTHIFNPSSFPLAVFGCALLATGASGITWGREIASTQFYPPHMYLALFLVALPGQYFFGVASMTMSAVVTAFAFSRLYFAASGVYYFYDSYIPIAVFLGMHLLFNDPSTSPRTGLGRVIFGALYGLSSVLLYDVLGRAGLPAYWDKILQVPLLNLSVRAIDGVARSRLLGALDFGALVPGWAPGTRNLAVMSVWALAFAGMSVAGLNDNHPGQWLPFWRRACAEERAYACPYLADVELGFCERGSSWACNEAGLVYLELVRTGEDLRRTDRAGAAEPFRRGCELGNMAACRNLAALESDVGSFASTPPTIEDLPIILRGSKGEVREQTPAELYALACRQGWSGACGGPGAAPQSN
jgi:hypothetical protein